jgi:hypothetical protein
MDLGKFSMSNIYSLHLGEVHLLLLKALDGKFEYRGRMIEFDFTSNPSHFIKTCLLPLVSTILATHSSYEVDRKLCEMISPNKEGQFSANSTFALELINLVFSLLNSMPTPQFPIVSPTPLISFHQVDPARLRDGFVFVFYARIDSVRTRAMPHRFEILSLVTRSQNLVVSYYQGGISAVYEADNIRTSASLGEDMFGQGWSYVILSLRETKEMFIMSIEIGDSLVEEIEFKPLTFEMPIEVTIGRVIGLNVSLSDRSPICLGPFALFGLPLPEGDQEVLLRGLADVMSSPSIILSSNSPDIEIDHSILRDDVNLLKSLKHHFTVDDLLSIFKCLSNAPKQFAEIAIGTLSNIMDGTQFHKIFRLQPDNHLALLTEISGIEETECAEFVLPLSRISSIPVVLLLTGRELLTYQLYQSLVNFLDMAQFSGIHHELLAQILFNPWIWCCNDKFTRVYRHWSVLLSRNISLVKSDFFTSFLIQCHLMINFSKHDFSDFNSVRLRLLKQLAAIYIDHQSTLAVVSVMRSVLDNRQELPNYLNLMIMIASVNATCFDQEVVLALTDIVDQTSDSEVFLLVLELIQQLKGPYLKCRMDHLCLTFFAKGIDLNVITLDAICIKALFHRPKFFSFPCDELADDLWFLWPIIAVLVYQREAEEAILALLISRSENFWAILNLLDLCVVLGIEFAAEFRDKFIIVVLENFPNDQLQVRTFVSLFYRFKTLPFSSEFLEVAREFGTTDITILEPKTVSLNPFNLEQLRAVTDFDAASHHLIFERRRTTVVLTEFFSVEADDLMPLADFLYGTKTVPFLESFEKFQATYVADIEREMVELLHRIKQLLNPPAIRVDFDVLYKALVGLERSRWDLLIENGLLELNPPPRFNEDLFNLSGQLIECPIARFFRPESIEGKPAIESTTFLVRLKLLSKCVPGAIDLSNGGFQFRIHRSFPVFVYHELIAYVRVAAQHLLFCLRSCTCIEIQMHNNEHFLDICRSFGIIVFSDPSKFVAQVADMWSESRCTSFEYILSLNLLNGRTFSDASNYPVFHVVGSDDTRPPEFHSGIDFTHSVYTNRKLIETAPANDSISAWVARTFGVTKSRSFKSEIFQISGPLERKRALGLNFDHAGLIRRTQNNLWAFSDGKLSMYSIDWRNQTTITPVFLNTPFPYSDELQIAAGPNYIVAYDLLFAAIMKILPDGRPETRKFSTYITAITAVGSSVLFVVDFHDVFMCLASDFPTNARHITSEKEAIDRLVADATIGVLVIVSKSGILRSMSLLDGRPLGQLDFVGQDVVTVLITEVWHFLVVGCKLKLHIATIRGKIIKSSELFKPITIALAFRIINGNDCVALVDSDCVLRLFEVIYPEKLQSIAKVRSQIVALEYLREEQAIVVIERDGSFAKVAFPQFVGP